MQDKSFNDEYRRRINKVQDYIESHPSKTLTLEELSAIAGFSKYHFHRIFKAVTHESLLQYIHRFKLEKAAQLLGQRLDMTLTDIAYHLGFTDSSVFSRSFKQMFGVSPRNYRNHYRKNCKEQYNISRYNKVVSKTDNKDKINADVEIITINTLYVGYLRFTGTYQELGLEFSDILSELFEKAYQQDLIDVNQMRVIAIYHDHPEFTNPNDFKTSIGITLRKGIKVDESQGLSYMEIPAGTYMVGHFYIHQQQYSDIWDYIYEEWLTSSGYVPSDNAPFEMYMNDYRTDPNQMHRVDIYLPVTPLNH